MAIQQQGVVAGGFGRGAAQSGSMPFPTTILSAYVTIAMSRHDGDDSLFYINEFSVRTWQTGLPALQTWQ
jgi:hypothetical protein